ncbi:branched-chain amino acid transport system II carrier protein [Alkalihalobacterium alkalinitrilicum]|uniref:branched-chain amino acid transport system II carrier protein n=1 Tax=Alkalihalobacterium alkalinitrilicum TaxID=427920 RepID=UPI0009959531|nr:branched-chain amino acid transport system II carrier protein [Alkalihalobacterium alkalinitrilicum]
MNTLSTKETVAIGLMTFALFLGAGNLIFPPAMGQAAGENVWFSTLGFLITGVGLPLLAIMAIARAGGNLQNLSTRVHPLFGVIFTLTMYLAIGPFFGIPRTGTVAYEIGAVPFLSPSVVTSSLPLFLFTVIFFSLTFWLALNPAKLVDRVGKLLTPILLVVITILAVKGIVTPLGPIEGVAPEYETAPFFKGFLDGYLTMDTIAALVFGIVIVSRITERGVTDPKTITAITFKAGVIAGTGLALVYLALAYLGASSVSTLGMLDNGGAILSGTADELFGLLGTVLLAVVITVACLTTSVGLVSACGEYFNKLVPNVSYTVIIAILSLFSLVMANMGLAQLISFSLPVLIAIYPIAIVLIILSFLHKFFHGIPQVYGGALIGAGLISIVDGLNATPIQIDLINSLFSYIPLYTEGVGWFLPAILGAVIGYLYGTSKLEKK